MSRPRSQLYNFEYSNTANLRNQKEIREILQRMEKWHALLESEGRHRHAKVIQNASIQIIDNDNYDYAKALYRMRTDIDWPVDIDEFLMSEEFLGNAIEVWPRLREELRIFTPDILAGEPPITEVLNRSTIGTGKSEIGKVRLLYDLYFLCCFNDPQLLYSGINKYTPILFVMQSIRDYITKRVLYEPARQMFTDMPWVRRNISWDKDKESTLILSNNVGLVPMMASANSIIGQATIGGHIDEANFMQVILESKRATGPGGLGGLYDQAQEVYSAIVRRRGSRFITRGPNPGCIYVSSSVNYRDDFLDRRIAQVRKEKPEDVKHVHIIDFRQFDVRPNTFSGDTFKFLVGTNDYPPKILTEEDKPGIHYPLTALIEDVPVEFMNEFRADPDRSQRDILGIASNAIHRFLSQTHKIVEAVRHGAECGLRCFVSKQNIILAEDDLPRILAPMLPKDAHLPRFVHIDLSRTGDRAAIAMVKVAGTAAIKKNNVVEMLPVFAVELAISIQPNTLNQIDIADIRAWVMELKTKYGFNLKAVSYDGFDSQESIQQWRKAGIASGNISLDKTTEPYDHFKQALYQGRVLLIDNNIMQTEFAQLERHERGGKSKIDHPVKGSKDIADAVAGAIYSASLNRSIRAEKDVTNPGGEKVRNTRRDAPTNRRSAVRR